MSRGRRRRSTRTRRPAPRARPRPSDRGTRAREGPKRGAWRARSRSASARTRARVSVERTTTKRHGCDSPTDGARCAAPSTRSSSASSTGSGRKRRTSRRSAMTAGERGAGGVVHAPAARVGGAVGRARRVELGAEEPGASRHPPPRGHRALVDARAREHRAVDRVGDGGADRGGRAGEGRRAAGRRRDADRVGGGAGGRAVVVERATPASASAWALASVAVCTAATSAASVSAWRTTHEDVDGADARQRRGRRPGGGQRAGRCRRWPPRCTGPRSRRTPARDVGGGRACPDVCSGSQAVRGRDLGSGARRGRCARSRGRPGG